MLKFHHISCCTIIYCPNRGFSLCHDEEDEKGDWKRTFVHKKMNARFARTIRQMPDVTTVINGLSIKFKTTCGPILPISILFCD